MSTLSNQQSIDLINRNKSDQLDGEDWSCLLIKQPQFSQYCDWCKLSGVDWCLLLREQPRFADKCDWDKLKRYHWNYLLIKQPQFAKHPMYKLKML